MTNREEFDSISIEIVSQKVADSMLILAREQDPSDGFPLFCHIKETFTPDELVYLGCIQVASKLKSALEKEPVMGMALEAIRKIDALEKKNKNNH